MRAVAQRPTDTKNRNCWHVLLDPETGSAGTLIAVFFDIPHLHQSAEVNARNCAEDYNLRLFHLAPDVHPIARAAADSYPRVGAWRDPVRTGA